MSVFYCQLVVLLATLDFLPPELSFSSLLLLLLYYYYYYYYYFLVAWPQARASEAELNFNSVRKQMQKKKLREK